MCLPYFARAATSREVTLTLGSAYRCMASPSREADGAAPPSATTPRFVFGFSTGHVGTTSLSQRSMYECSCTTRAHCKCELAGFGFFHETGRRRGLQESHPSLYEWHEAPAALGPGPPGALDVDGLDTGSIFQHPNGSVYAMYPGKNATEMSRIGPRSNWSSCESDICYARARDSTLTVWDKLCYSADSVATGGRIANPTCTWCRANCPARCSGTPAGPSPFGNISELLNFRDPPAPWLAACNASTEEQCWFQPIASFGLVPPGMPTPESQGTLLMMRNNFNLSGPWELAVPGGEVNSSNVLWGYWSRGEALSCPDVFQPPQPTRADGRLAVYTDINDEYLIGVIDDDQVFRPLPPFSAGTGPDAIGSLPLSNGGSIMKSGGVGPSNAVRSASEPPSRRLYFGTRALPDLSGIPVEDGIHGLGGKVNFSGFIPTLPRDLSIQRFLKATADDAGYRVLNAFAPELQPKAC